MGCDIHCYLEYKRPDSDRWSDFGGRINPGRNYRLFSALAGVRSSGDASPVVAPRGFPEDASYSASGDYWLYVGESDGEGCCSPARAEEYVLHYGCRYRNELKRHVSHPDFHSHSWMTPEEYSKAIEGHNEPEYRAILAALRSLESDGNQARIVFWFDN